MNNQFFLNFPLFFEKMHLVPIPHKISLSVQLLKVLVEQAKQIDYWEREFESFVSMCNAVRNSFITPILTHSRIREWDNNPLGSF